MKYIRTKNEVVDLTGWKYDKENKCYFNEKNKIADGEYSDLIYEEDILKKGNKIEEVCDIILYVLPHCYHHPVLMPSNQYVDGSWYYKGQILEGMKLGTIDFVRAMIWAEKGMIYVAKMNDKGELELL